MTEFTSASQRTAQDDSFQLRFRYFGVSVNVITAAMATKLLASLDSMQVDTTPQTGYDMNRKLSAILLAIMTLAASGCATMSGDECAMSDWHAVGFSDGANGYTSDRYSKYSKSCAKHGITPDFRAYQSGRDEGLVEFCQPSRGYNLGASGGRYHGVCDAALEEEFLDGYRVGHQLYTLRSAVNNASSRISNKEYELERIRNKMRDNEARVISDETTTEDRVLLLADLKELSERKGELEAEIEELIKDRARHEYELADYERTVAAYGF